MELGGRPATQPVADDDGGARGGGLGAGRQQQRHPPHRVGGHHASAAPAVGAAAAGDGANLGAERLCTFGDEVTNTTGAADKMTARVYGYKLLK